MEMSKGKVRQKDSRIELPLNRENVYKAEIKALQSQLEQATQNNAHLSKGCVAFATRAFATPIFVASATPIFVASATPYFRISATQTAATPKILF